MALNQEKHIAPSPTQKGIAIQSSAPIYAERQYRRTGTEEVTILFLQLLEHELTLQKYASAESSAPKPIEPTTNHNQPIVQQQHLEYQHDHTRNHSHDLVHKHHNHDHHHGHHHGHVHSFTPVHTEPLPSWIQIFSRLNPAQKTMFTWFLLHCGIGIWLYCMGTNKESLCKCLHQLVVFWDI